MNKFATGMLLGGAAAMAGMGYLMKDKRTYQRLARKGKKMVVKAEEAIDDIIDDMRKGSGNEASSRMGSADGIHFRRGKQKVSRLAVGT